MAISLYNLSQQVRSKTNKGTWQEVIQAVRNAYAIVVKQEWYINKGFDVNEINGAFIVTFKNLLPVLDEDFNRYYVNIPSTYLGLPQEGGINWMAFMACPDECFAFCNAGTVGRMNEIQAGVMGGAQLTYPVNDNNEGMKFYFPRMTSTESKLPIFTRLTLALDDYDIDKPINITPDMQKLIVDSVIALYTPTPKPINEPIK